MKKYYIADLLVLARFILAVLLGFVAFFPAFGLGEQSMIGVGLTFFIVGELTDAFDGPAARRWHYPQDGKYRWWRENDMNVILDKIADICLIVTMMIFVFMRVSFVLTVCLVGIAAPFALSVEFYLRPRLSVTNPVLCNRILMLRRYLYVLGLCLVGMVTLWMTDWPRIARLTITVLALIIAPFMVAFKRDRLTEVDTPV